MSDATTPRRATRREVIQAAIAVAAAGGAALPAGRAAAQADIPRDKNMTLIGINSRDGRVTPPVLGGWNGDRGEFFGDDEDNGRPVRVRFLWERLGPDTARWSQDFALIGSDGAVDGPWETNWVMEMRRLRD